jgi:hypothetical protein
VSSKFFDKQFDSFEHIEDWYDIPTPNFQTVMDYQKFEPDVCKWMYVMGGRCFDVGDLDGWQIIPFLKGIARSGKSTLITKFSKNFTIMKMFAHFQTILNGSLVFKYLRRLHVHCTRGEG